MNSSVMQAKLKTKGQIFKIHAGKIVQWKEKVGFFSVKN